MQLEDSSSSVEGFSESIHRPCPELVVAKTVAEKNSLATKIPQKRTTNFIAGLRIAQKIAYGYTVAIGIAVIGTTIGLRIGEHYQSNAQNQLMLAHEQQYLLDNLEKAIMSARSHPQRLVTVLGNSIWFDYEIAKFYTDVTEVQSVLLELKKFAETQPDHLAVPEQELKNLLKSYQKTTLSYTQLIESLWQQTNPAKIKPENLGAAQQSVFNFIRDKSAVQVGIEFEQLSEQLTQILSAAQRQQQQANEQLQQAERLRVQVIVMSMILSVAIASLLAFVTTRAIAQPLKSLTQVAQQVIQESNFTLRAPIDRTDEAGLLATSLNQLIQWVGDYTDELNKSRLTLEQRVQTRTAELTQALTELKQTQAQLIQTEKMSSLGQLVAGVAHEINNPVNFIYGNIEYANNYIQDLLKLVNLYRRVYPDSTPEIEEALNALEFDFLVEDLPKLIYSLKIGAERIREIVLSLRNFSRLDEAQIKSVDIHEGIDTTLSLLNFRLHQKIQVVKKYSKLAEIECYPAQLNQVFMNILANAIDALEETSLTHQCSVATDQKVKQETVFEDSQSREEKQKIPTIIIKTEWLDNRHIQIKIRDNGPGIIPEVRNKLFDPFFTTKPVGKGTGLGLAIGYQIIAKHEGKIEVKSELGRGTEFKIILPIHLGNSVYSCRGS